MSTMQSIDQIQQLRGEIIQTNQAIRTLTGFAKDGKVELRDFLTIVRVLSGGNESLTGLISNLQVTLAAITTARTAAAALKVELGPLGLILIAGTTLVGMEAYTAYNSQIGKTAGA